MLLLAAALLAAMSFSTQSAGLQLAVTNHGVKFELTAAFVRIAFDIGQSCSKSDSCGGLLA
ncbi:hypothetical protein P1X14_04485 [Sphingomonas sp. AOB5]|uniref:hypothetical protein n=1 Tax=Sphingomonas sp. AOB5 TaxID=3034017 RepID=UPI0023F98406|nr:hypothetical protein [Sphingomonas sp. AOB5]MDF7774495.1 hypothetical protein [Sphingomonas sp. AOB5]